MIRLIIKGSFGQARAALDTRGLATCMALVETADGIDAVVHDDDAVIVARWFAEPIEAAKGQGFPPGTLLFYSAYPDHKEE